MHIFHVNSISKIWDDKVDAFYFVCVCVWGGSFSAIPKSFFKEIPISRSTIVAGVGTALNAEVKPKVVELLVCLLVIFASCSPSKIDDVKNV